VHLDSSLWLDERLLRQLSFAVGAASWLAEDEVKGSVLIQYFGKNPVERYFGFICTASLAPGNL
jgi:hypothetical protein